MEGWSFTVGSVHGNKQHVNVGIDSTQQRMHLSVENAVAVDNECVQCSMHTNTTINHGESIDTQLTKVFLQKEHLQYNNCRREIICNNYGGVVVYSWL